MVLEPALPSRSSVTSFVVVTAMLLAALCATPEPTTPFTSRLAELQTDFEIATARAHIARLEHELAELRRTHANTIRVE